MILFTEKVSFYKSYRTPTAFRQWVFPYEVPGYKIGTF